jgi:hypothetical protein
LIAGDEGRDCYDAAISSRETWSFPEIVPENLLRVAFERGSNGADVFRLRHGICSFHGFLSDGNGSAAGEQAE